MEYMTISTTYEVSLMNSSQKGLGVYWRTSPSLLSGDRERIFEDVVVTLDHDYFDYINYQSKANQLRLRRNFFYKIQHSKCNT